MILGLPRYRVSPKGRAPLLGFMLDGLRDAGCRILNASGPDEAPFVVTFEAPDGERLGIVAYAFTAKSRDTGGRPSDERRFQIKYGGKPDDNAHVLWRDPLALYTTLLVGIDVAEGFFVAADPAMHEAMTSPMKLFRDEHARTVRREGWCAWETEPEGDFPDPIEVLVGGVRNRMLDLARFERAAAGLPPGDRHLLAERPALFRRSARRVEAIRDA